MGGLAGRPEVGKAANGGHVGGLAGRPEVGKAANGGQRGWRASRPWCGQVVAVWAQCRRVNALRAKVGGTQMWYHGGYRYLGATEVLRQATFQERGLKAVRANGAVDQGRVTLHPHIVGAQCGLILRGLLLVQDSVIGDFNITRQLGVKVEPGVARVGRVSQVAHEQQGVGRLLGIADELADERGSGFRRSRGHVNSFQMLGCADAVAVKPAPSAGA